MALFIIYFFNQDDFYSPKVAFYATTTNGGMFLLPISKHCPVKIHESLLDAKMLKPALSRQ